MIAGDLTGTDTMEEEEVVDTTVVTTGVVALTAEEVPVATPDEDQTMIRISEGSSAFTAGGTLVNLGNLLRIYEKP